MNHTENAAISASASDIAQPLRPTIDAVERAQAMVRDLASCTIELAMTMDSASDDLQSLGGTIRVLNYVLEAVKNDLQKAIAELLRLNFIDLQAQAGAHS